ncbi:MAG: Tim44 domain-containing protein [Candidatus Rokuibacteriota bacterium]|nr:MAG: Tim44 domain-containing protein [Candidatus Rokubacteria bacterium]
MRRSTLAVAALALAALLALQAGEACARAGSGGSRGSRSSSTPARPAPTSPTNPSSPSRQLASPTPAPAQPSRGWMGGLMGGLAGFALGGLLGSMLFGGGFGGGIGLLEILLIGAGLFLLFRFVSARRQQQPTYATAGAPYPSGDAYAGGSAYGGTAPQETATPEMPAVASDLDRGLGHIRSMDPSFDPGFVADAARGLFGDVQRALTARDMSPVSGRLTSRMYTELTEQCDRLRAARQTNRMEAMNLRRADVTEAWQESGQDFVTVYLGGSLVDYTVDDATGAVVAGAKAPQEFEEFWTFARPVGPNPWRLSAIQSS